MFVKKKNIKKKKEKEYPRRIISKRLTHVYHKRFVKGQGMKKKKSQPH